MAQFFDLPSEVIFRILCFLDLSELVSLSHTNSSLRAAVVNSPGLQFRFLAHDAAVKINQSSNHVASERLSALRRLEGGWLNMSIDFQTKIPVLHYPSGLYDLSAGVCVLGDTDRQTLHYCKLPSRETDAVEWKQIKVGCVMVDFGLSVYEHDLIAVLTFNQDPLRSHINVIDMRLIQLSTGSLHPLAQTPVLTLEESEWPKPSTLIEIVGDHMVIIISHHFFDGPAKDRLYVLEWKTGTVKLNVEIENQIYHNVIFLSPTILCLPNRRQNTLDIWLIPDTPIAATAIPLIQPFLQLELPKLIRMSQIISISCRSEPNPSPQGMRHSTRPFHASSEDAIVIFNICVFGLTDMSTFTMYVHRRALLELCFSRERKPVYTPEVMLDPTLEPEVVPWQEWGPDRTRWFQVEDRSSNWVTTTVGQRAVILSNFSEEEEEEDEGNDEEPLQTVLMLDFNQRTVKKVASDQPEGLRVVDRPSLLSSKYFSTPIESRLPCVVAKLNLPPTGRPLAGLLIDEEWLVGVRTIEPHASIAELEVLHMGSPLY